MRYLLAALGLAFFLVSCEDLPMEPPRECPDPDPSQRFGDFAAMPQGKIRHFHIDAMTRALDGYYPATFFSSSTPCDAMGTGTLAEKSSTMTVEALESNLAGDSGSLRVRFTETGSIKESRFVGCKTTLVGTTPVDTVFERTYLEKNGRFDPIQDTSHAFDFGKILFLVDSASVNSTEALEAELQADLPPINLTDATDTATYPTLRPEFRLFLSRATYDSDCNAVLATSQMSKLHHEVAGAGYLAGSGLHSYYQSYLSPEFELYHLLGKPAIPLSNFSTLRVDSRD